MTRTIGGTERRRAVDASKAIEAVAGAIGVANAAAAAPRWADDCRAVFATAPGDAHADSACAQPMRSRAITRALPFALEAAGAGSVSELATAEAVDTHAARATGREERRGGDGDGGGGRSRSGGGRARREGDALYELASITMPPLLAHAEARAERVTRAVLAAAIHGARGGGGGGGGGRGESGPYLRT